ncbi:MAG: hypothetical protein DLM62_08065 [Pseudonocardiales bacterium]|nr:MAG: hypothetical protein DLM62_08065 [Pseudonocardiales bacterium]
MRISDIFAMGGSGGGYDDGGYNDYCSNGECGAGSEALDDPRLRRRGLAEIIGSRADGGSGLSALFIEH